MSAETGMRIRKIREFRNFTQNHMADRLNISQNAYSKIENGITPITTDRIEEIAKILDVPSDSILNAERQIFNFDNNNVAKGYGYVGTLQEESKEMMQQTIDTQAQQIQNLKETMQQTINVQAQEITTLKEILQKQTDQIERLLKTIESMANKG